MTVYAHLKYHLKIMNMLVDCPCARSIRYSLANETHMKVVRITIWGVVVPYQVKRHVSNWIKVLEQVLLLSPGCHILHSQEMRPAYGMPISAPSPALLQYLRFQAQEICFFNSSLGWNFYHHFLNPSHRRSRRKGDDDDDIHSSAESAEHFYRRQAICEASVFNFDFLSHGSRRNAQASSTIGAERHRSFLKRVAWFDSAKQPRQASTLFRPLLQKIWGSRRQKGKAALKPDDLPERPSFLDDVSGAVLGRRKVGKASNEMKLRCTELNENGTVTLVNGEFKKSELIAKVGVPATALQVRDQKLTTGSVRSSASRSQEN